MFIYGSQDYIFLKILFWSFVAIHINNFRIRCMFTRRHEMKRAKHGRIGIVTSQLHTNRVGLVFISRSELAALASVASEEAIKSLLK